MDFGLFLFGVALGFPAGAAFHAWLKFGAVPALIRHGWR